MQGHGVVLTGEKKKVEFLKKSCPNRFGQRGGRVQRDTPKRTVPSQSNGWTLKKEVDEDEDGVVHGRSPDDQHLEANLVQKHITIDAVSLIHIVRTRVRYTYHSPIPKLSFSPQPCRFCWMGVTSVRRGNSTIKI